MAQYIPIHLTVFFYPSRITAHAQWYSEIYIFDALARNSANLNVLNKHTVQQPEYTAARARLGNLLIDAANPDINELVTVIDITSIGQTSQ